MITKTEKLKELFKIKDFKGALKIAKRFNRIFTKDEIKTILRAYEMFSNEKFYNSLGFVFEIELRNAKKIIKDKYKIWGHHEAINKWN